MPKWMSRMGLLNIALIILLAAPLLAHMYNGHFSRFMADDYCTSVIGLKYGTIGGMLHWYNTWSGLYTNFTIKSLIALLGPGFASILPALVIISLWVTIFWVMAQICDLLRFQQSRVVALIFSLLIVYITIDGAPALIQSVYWLGAVIPYTVPLILLALYIGIFIYTLTHNLESKLPIGSMVTGFIITLLIGGLSEIYLTFQLAALTIAAALSFIWLPPRLKRPALSILITSLIGSGIAAVIVLTSPGTLVRQSQFPDHMSLPNLIVQSLSFSAAFTASALAYFAPFALLTTLSTSALMAFRKRPVELPFRLYPTRIRWLLGSSAAIAFILVTAAITPGVYAVSGTPPDRVFILPTFILGLTAVFWGCLIGFTLRKKAPQTRQSGRSILITAIFVLILAFGPLTSILRSVTLAPKLSVYAKEWDEQEQQIRLEVAEGSAEVVVKPLSVDLPQLIGLDTIGPDPTLGANPCAADYYGVQTLIAE